MDRVDTSRYYFIVMDVYHRLRKKLLPISWGTKQDWEREFEKHKYNDKNLKGFVNHLIRSDILKEKSYLANTVYHPDEESAKQAQVEAESADAISVYERYGYEIVRRDFNFLFRL